MEEFQQINSLSLFTRSLKLTGSSKKHCSLIFIGGGKREEEDTIVQGSEENRH